MAKQRSKKGPDRAKQAAARAGKQRMRLLSDLSRARDELSALDDRRRIVLGKRDQAVAQLRSLGVSTAELARWAGTSRQALMKRESHE